MSLEFNGTVGLVGGGAWDPAAFDLVRERAKFLVGVDGGGDQLLKRGIEPDAIIGDLDSLSEAGRAAIPPARVVEITEQDSTDFDKALRSVSAPLILATGFSGARLDHELAALHSLVRHPGPRVVVIGAVDLIVHVPARLHLDLPPGLRLSLFPLDGVRARLRGLRWSFDALDLHPARKIGTSNAVGEGPVELTTDRPGLLLILPRAALDPVIVALREADFHSPPG